VFGSSTKWILYGALASTLASTLLLSSEAQAQALGYPAARHGGSYMHNFYLPPSPSATPWAPSWHPSGERIAVSMQGSIWAIELATGVATEMTSGSAYHSSPVYSPNGRWLLYTADEDGARIQLEVLEIETGEVTRLTDDDQLYLDPAFSLDGTQIAYVSTQPSGYFNVYVRGFWDGAWTGQPVPVTRDNDFGKERLYFGSHDMHITPSWLPRGDELLLVSNREIPLGSGYVWRVPAKVDGIQEAVAVLREQSLYRTRPHVARDGTRFIYSSTAGSADQFNNLYVQPTVGGEPYKLTFFTHDAFNPRWSPDGEWIAFISNEGGLPHLQLLETFGGALRRVQITERRWSRPMGRLELTVQEAGSTATPARVILYAADGRAYAPHDAYARIGHSGDHSFHTAGESTLDLPTGPATLTVVRGFESHPRTVEVTIQEGQTTRASITLDPLWDLGAEGCFSGSTHTHMNYAGNLHNTLDNMVFMSRAEDQDIVNEQVANKDNRVLDHQFFVPGGGAHPASVPDQVVIVGQEYRPPFYGHVFMLGLEEHLISPFVTGYEGTAIESLYPSNTDMLRKAKAQGATVGYVHPYFGTEDPLKQGLGGGKGFMVDAALGTTDALEWSLPNTASFFPLYAAWNNGLGVVAVGGEDSITDLHRWRLMGSVRTYVCPAGGVLTADSWLEGLREGRSFVTSGPLLRLSVDGRSPGERIAMRTARPVQVQSTLRSIVPLDYVEVVWNGKVVHTERLTGDRTEMDLDIELPITQSGWLHVRTIGNPSEGFPLDVGVAQAFTNPVWIDVDAQPVRDVAAAEYGIEWIDTLRALAEEWPGWRSEHEKAHVYAQFDEARAIYEGLLQEARQ